MQRLKLLLLFGGESPEHDVSISSTRNIYAALDDQKYDIMLGYIARDGKWWLVNDIDILAEHHHAQLVPVLGTAQFTTEPLGKNIQPDVILPILHGANGEDGSVQGLGQLMHIPMVGCGVLSSAMCMDKDVTKRLLKAANLPIVEYAVHDSHQPLPDFAHLTLQLGNPLFIKPANLGSSVGVSKVTTKEEFVRALEIAQQHDSKILIEQAIQGRELECAVLGNHQPEASVVGEVKADQDFYSYDAKYDPHSQTHIVIPAELPPDVSEKIRHIAVQAYQTLECRGLARVDFFLTEDNQLYINEINTLPGFTNISMYPKLWRASGLNYPALIDRLIELAIEKR